MLLYTVRIDGNFVAKLLLYAQLFFVIHTRQTVYYFQHVTRKRTKHIFVLYYTEVVPKPPKRFPAKSIANPGNLGIYVGTKKKKTGGLVLLPNRAIVTTAIVELSTEQ